MKLAIRFVTCSLLLTLPSLLWADAIDFQKQIGPLLEKHCLSCHSPGNEKGDISLATADNLLENEFVVPGDPDASYLVELISPMEDAPPAMPKGKPALSEQEVSLIKQWIAAGAKWPEEIVLRERSKADRSWWAFQPLSKEVPPQPANLPAAWSGNPIDRYVFAKLQENHLLPNPPASKRDLIRRATYDLTGLPPTPQEVKEFIEDDDPQAYAKLIDRLLASPHYGERWGRHWLDVVRFGESNGFERNILINDLWPFRDYVIKSFNDDKPFDQLIKEHLAGDVIAPGQFDKEIGTAFLVCGPYDNVGNQDAVQKAQIRANTLDEMIRATGEAFLGLTIGCARCHDHKFDPILQEDYYSLYSTFSGVQHGTKVIATPEQQKQRTEKLTPLNAQLKQLTQKRNTTNKAVLDRAMSKIAEYEKLWPRPKTNRLGTEENFSPVQARFVRLVSRGRDDAPTNKNSFTIDEFEVWSATEQPVNVALAKNGATATGPSRIIEDFPDAYGPQLAIDGVAGRRFLATAGYLMIELKQPTLINRVLFSSARGEDTPDHRKFNFLAEYKIEASLDGKAWQEIANSDDRKPVSTTHRDLRLRRLETTKQEAALVKDLDKQIAQVTKQIQAIPAFSSAWVGSRSPASAKGPFHIFLGGSPQRKGPAIVPAGLKVLAQTAKHYELPETSAESKRRTTLANWMADSSNPLTPRVLANRLWHYHFGTGIVDTPSDFGYMGGRPSHPRLLDYLATLVHKENWKLKSLHRQIMLSQTYQQASSFRKEAAAIDGDSRLLWRFPPRRLSAEEIRDTMLAVSGKLNKSMGGPGFRLYQYLQDNVATYVPLDEHGADTYRRAIYHQNARATVVDLMTDYDQPDCAFSTPRRAETTTPLQALTSLNHRFTLDLSKALAQRLEDECGVKNRDAQIKLAYQLCFGREPNSDELREAAAFVKLNSLVTYCRVLLNTSEMIYVR